MKVEATTEVKIQLRAMSWEDVIVHFSTMPFNEKTTPKDLVNYFHFQYLNVLNIGRWTSPYYLREVPRAKKLLSLYGKDFSFYIIQLLFRRYNSILSRGIQDIKTYGLALLTSDDKGWITESLLFSDNKEKETDRKSRMRILLSKTRSDWTRDEIDEFNKLLNSKPGDQ